MTGETPRELAEAYADALESRADSDEYEEAQEHLDALRSRLERFEESYGESDPATEELKERVQSAKDEVADLEEQRRKPEELERELLEAARSFMLDDEWLHPDVIQALNRALVGAPHETLRVDDLELSGPEDAKDLDDLNRFDVIDVMRKLALDKLGEADDIERVWKSIEGTTKEGAFRVVAEAGKADPDDIMESLDEDIERSAARNRLKNGVYDSDVNPYHRVDGTYHLSTAGRYIASEFVGAEDSDQKEPDEGGRGVDGQMELGDESAVVNGGGANG